jgi:hypothetical protein
VLHENPQIERDGALRTGSFRALHAASGKMVSGADDDCSGNGDDGDACR